MSIQLPGEHPTVKGVDMHSIPARHALPGRCVVCGAASQRNAASPARESYPTCLAVACRMVVSRRTALGEAGFRHYLRIQAQQRQRQAALAAECVARRQAETEENAAAWSTLRARLRLAPPEEPLRLLLPSGSRHARRLAGGRRDRYRVHLLGIAAEAAGSACASHPEATGIAVLAAASSLPGQLCALCGGGCCTRGDKHAYLDAPTLRLFMDAHPHLSADEVVAAYLDRVATRTQSGSCINHTRQGCCLRREMRSDTCNRFACESLARLQAAQREAQPVQMILVVRRKQDQWRRTDPGLDNAINGGAVLCEAGTRRIRKGMQGQACAIGHALSNGHSKTLQECTRPPILVEHRAAARAGVEPCQIKYRWAR